MAYATRKPNDILYYTKRRQGGEPVSVFPLLARYHSVRREGSKAADLGGALRPRQRICGRARPGCGAVTEPARTRGRAEPRAQNVPACCIQGTSEAAPPARLRLRRGGAGAERGQPAHGRRRSSEGADPYAASGAVGLRPSGTCPRPRDLLPSPSHLGWALPPEPCGCRAAQLSQLLRLRVSDTRSGSGAAALAPR